MKVLIWFLCIFTNALITTLIKEAGVMLGAIPTVILYIATFWLARTLCKKWDEYKENKAIEQSVPVQVAQTTPADTTEQVRFCRKCGEKLLDNSRFCRKCGTEIVHEKLNYLTMNNFKETTKNEVTHKWRCHGCGNMRTQSPCEYCGIE